MNRERLKLLKPMYEGYVENGCYVGITTAVAKDGEEVYFDAFGYADRERKIPMSYDTIFRIYSMTKPMTAVASMILMERGIIDIEDPVSKYMDSFKGPSVITRDGIIKAKNEITIKNLMNMTSGMPYPDPNGLAGREVDKLFAEQENRRKAGNAYKTVEFCSKMGELPLAFEPGARWMYGTSADVLGAIIEVASGMKYSEFLKKEIFEPLNMTDTAFYVPKEKQDRFSQPYEYIKGEKELKLCKWRHLGITEQLTPPDFESGGAGLVSTVPDYLKFAMMLANKGEYKGTRIISERAFSFMTKNQLNQEQLASLNWDSLVGFGYGTLVRVMNSPDMCRSFESVGSFGWDGWMGTYFQVDPKENLVYMHMLQKCGGGRTELERKLKNIVYSAL